MPLSDRGSRIGPMPIPDLTTLTGLLTATRRLVVLTGAGCSTESGIPDYRSPGGLWTHHKPVMYADYVRSPAIRRRYWARSLVGWRTFQRAEPNEAHRALARLELAGRLHYLITQNVDRLHHQARCLQPLDGAAGAPQ